METKTIGYILIGTALLAGGTALTIHLVKKGKDKKKAADAKKLSYSASSEQVQTQPTQQEETPVVNTPKPKPTAAPKPTPAPAQTDNSFSLDKTLNSPDLTVRIEITMLQKYLKTKGYSLGVDGKNGKEMRTAMYRAMGLKYKDKLSISLRTFFSKAEAAFKAPMSESSKITLAGFYDFVRFYANAPADDGVEYISPYDIGKGDIIPARATIPEYHPGYKGFGSPFFGLPLFGLR